jgi:LytS/YehU family sensor histidine kinase
VQNGKDPEKERGGIGLTNTRQRLRLLYPNRHQLTIQEKENEFRVQLMLELE